MRKYKLVWKNSEEVVLGKNFTDAFNRAGYNWHDYMVLVEWELVEENVATATFDKV